MGVLIPWAALGAAAYISTPQGARRPVRFIVRRMNVSGVDKAINALRVQTSGHKNKYVQLRSRHRTRSAKKIPHNYIWAGSMQ